MDEFGTLARDYGFRPQGKSAPMKSDGGDRRSRPPSSSSPFGSEENQIFDDVFGGPPKYSNKLKSTSAMSDFGYDSIFKNSASTNNSEARSNPTSSNLPAYDKPVYDDDIFDGLPGMKSKSVSSSTSARYEDTIFASMATSQPKQSQQSDHFDDLLGNLGRTEKVEPIKHHNSKGPRDFDDLIPGFGSGSPASSNRWHSEPTQKSTAKMKETSHAIDDPFVVLESTPTSNSSKGFFTDPLEEISELGKSGSTKAGRSSVSGGVFGDIDPLNSFSKSTHAVPREKSSFRYSESQSPKVPADDFQEYRQTAFTMPSVSRGSHGSFDQIPSPSSHNETSSQVDMSPTSVEHVQQVDDIWLTVSEIPLFTQITRAPPPSRPPPPIPGHTSKSEKASFAQNTRKAGDDFSQSPRPFQPAAKSHVSSPLDELESFAMGRMPDNGDYNCDAQSGEEMDSNSAAAAMKEAMDKAEAKFKHAKEVRERDHAKAFKNKESVQLEGDEQAMEEEIRRERLDREREEEEREQRRLEKERMREIERQKARQAVERATREARERAASEARLKAERAAVQRAQAEARERAAIEARERAERAAAEARERASAEARERAAAEAREKEAQEKAAAARAEADARRRAERAAVERVAAEARERAAAGARDRAAAARMNQQKNDNDLESFFSMGSRPSSAPRPRATSDSGTDPLSRNRQGSEGAQRTSTAGVSSNIRKTSSTTNIVDDLSSIFGAAPAAGDFHDIEGETEERRRARMERHQRTQERAAKALAEKNQRDLQSQQEQEERHRISQTLDIEIKRWSAGKEGNLRAMLSTLQYVLWPECGWQPVSLTDLITGANVKKAYRKATLCIHPDKVQQKGANLQQKYVAEKVFDLLKEAWNKFNSEELF